MKSKNFLLDESSEFQKPKHSNMSLKQLQDRINTRYRTGECAGGSCYDCDNLECKRDHDAETYYEEMFFLDVLIG